VDPATASCAIVLVEVALIRDAFLEWKANLFEFASHMDALVGLLAQTKRILYLHIFNMLQQLRLKIFAQV
jgi:hypothetical protein